MRYALFLRSSYKNVGQIQQEESEVDKITSARLAHGNLLFAIMINMYTVFTLE